MEFVHKKETTAEEKVQFGEKLTEILASLEKYFQGKKFGSGETISYVDFALYEFLRQLQTNAATKDTFAKYSNLGNYLARFEKLPQLESYLKEVNSK